MTRAERRDDPRRREVIVVATRKGLSDALARVVATQVDIMQRSLLGLPGMIASGALRYAARELMRRRNADLDLVELLRALEGHLNLGAPMAHFEPDDAAVRFKFGVGHRPADGSIYVQHPVFVDHYVAPHEFAQTVARERHAAVQQLCSALGVKELHLLDATSHTKAGLFGGTIPLPKVAAQLGIKASFDTAGAVIRTVYSRFGAPRRQPHVPPDLLPWVEWDSELRTMARGRLEGHLLEQVISLEFKQATSVGGSLAATIAQKGLSVGASFKEMSHSVWRFHAEYWPLD